MDVDRKPKRADLDVLERLDAPALEGRPYVWGIVGGCTECRLRRERQDFRYEKSPFS